MDIKIIAIIISFFGAFSICNIFIQSYTAEKEGLAQNMSGYEEEYSPLFSSIKPFRYENWEAILTNKDIKSKEEYLAEYVNTTWIIKGKTAPVLFEELMLTPEYKEGVLEKFFAYLPRKAFQTKEQNRLIKEKYSYFEPSELFKSAFAKAGITLGETSYIKHTEEPYTYNLSTIGWKKKDISLGENETAKNIIKLTYLTQSASGILFSYSIFFDSDKEWLVITPIDTPEITEKFAAAASRGIRNRIRRLIEPIISYISPIYKVLTFDYPEITTLEVQDVNIGKYIRWVFAIPMQILGFLLLVELSKYIIEIIKNAVGIFKPLG